MLVKYITKRFLDWSPEMRRRLRNLTIDHEKDAFSGMRDAVCKGRNPLTCVAFIDDKLVGWSIFTPDTPIVYKKNVIMVYVRKNYRRMSIGQNLVKLIKAQIKEKCIGIGWNYGSAKFFSKISKSVPAFKMFKNFV